MMDKNVLTCDTVIIGAGSAGLEAYKAAEATGAYCILVESGPLGTGAKRSGETPIAALMAAGKKCHALSELAKYGVNAPFDIALDTDNVLNHLRSVRAKDTSDILSFIYRIPEHKRLIGKAVLVDPHRLLVDDHHEVVFKSAVIATGSTPVVPYALSQYSGNGGVYTTNDLFDLDHLPQSMAVFGSTRDGLQIGQALSYLGVKVVVFGSQNIWSLTDETVIDAATDAFKARFNLVIDSYTTAIEKYDQGFGIYYLNNHLYENVLAVDSILAASIRYPKIEGMNIRGLGLKLNEQGCLLVNEQTMQTSLPHIFAAGEVTNLNMTTVIAKRQGSLAGVNAARYPDIVAMPPELNLRILYTDPELAVIGMSYEQVKQRAKEGELFVASEVRVNDGLFRLTKQEGGMLRLYCDEYSHLILGAELCMHDGGHLAHLIAMAIQHKLTIEQVGALPYFTPSYEQILQEACQIACKNIVRKALGAYSSTIPRALVTPEHVTSSASSATASATTTASASVATASASSAAVSASSVTTAANASPATTAASSSVADAGIPDDTNTSGESTEAASAAARTSIVGRTQGSTQASARPSTASSAISSALAAPPEVMGDTVAVAPDLHSAATTTIASSSAAPISSSATADSISSNATTNTSSSRSAASPDISLQPEAQQLETQPPEVHQAEARLPEAQQPKASLAKVPHAAPQKESWQPEVPQGNKDGEIRGEVSSSVTGLHAHELDEPEAAPGAANNATTIATTATETATDTTTAATAHIATTATDTATTDTDTDTAANATTDASSPAATYTDATHTKSVLVSPSLAQATVPSTIPTPDTVGALPQAVAAGPQAQTRESLPEASSNQVAGASPQVGGASSPVAVTAVDPAADTGAALARASTVTTVTATTATNTEVTTATTATPLAPRGSEDNAGTTLVSGPNSVTITGQSDRATVTAAPASTTVTASTATLASTTATTSAATVTTATSAMTDATTTATRTTATNTIATTSTTELARMGQDAHGASAVSASSLPKALSKTWQQHAHNEGSLKSGGAGVPYLSAIGTGGTVLSQAEAALSQVDSAVQLFADSTQILHPGINIGVGRTTATTVTPTATTATTTTTKATPTHHHEAKAGHSALSTEALSHHASAGAASTREAVAMTAMANDAAANSRDATANSRDATANTRDAAASTAVVVVTTEIGIARETNTEIAPDIELSPVTALSAALASSLDKTTRLAQEMSSTQAAAAKFTAETTADARADATAPTMTDARAAAATQVNPAKAQATDKLSAPSHVLLRDDYSDEVVLEIKTELEQCVSQEQEHAAQTVNAAQTVGDRDSATVAPTTLAKDSSQVRHH